MLTRLERGMQRSQNTDEQDTYGKVKTSICWVHSLFDIEFYLNGRSETVVLNLCGTVIAYTEPVNVITPRPFQNLTICYT